MFVYKMLLVVNEGLIFGIFAIGVYIAFQWLRFPDLTPDGSFVIGSCVYVKVCGLGMTVPAALGLALLSGVVAGLITAFLNRAVRIPAIVAGLVVSLSLFSASWLLLGKPNLFLDSQKTLMGDLLGIDSSRMLLEWLLVFCATVVGLMICFSQSIWGLRLRAIGENPLLANDIKSSEGVYTFLGLGMANGLVAFSGALFSQRSFSADINMGVGQTILGLISMILGLLIAGNRRSTAIVVSSIILGAVIHKAVIFLTLEAGMPAEAFRLVSSFFFVVLFFAVRSTGINFLRGLKWS